MTLQEALAIADQTKPTHRQPLDKLQGSTTAAVLSAGVEALAKSYDVMGSAIVDMQKRLDQAAADVEYIQNFTPNSPIRRFHS
jgi:hypothetical protein